MVLLNSSCGLHFCFYCCRRQQSLKIVLVSRARKHDAARTSSSVSLARLHTSQSMVFPLWTSVLARATFTSQGCRKTKASIRHDMKSGVDVSGYEGVFRLVTENIVKRSHHKKRS